MVKIYFFFFPKDAYEDIENAIDLMLDVPLGDFWILRGK